MVLATIMNQRQWVDADGYQHTRRDTVDVPLAVAEYYDMRIEEDIETDESTSVSDTEDMSEDEEATDKGDSYVCGYEGPSGTCSREVDGPDAHCWQHS